MEPITRNALGAMSACLLLTGAAMATPSNTSNEGAPSFFPTIPNGGAKAIPGVPIVLREQLGSQADRIARQLMAPQLLRASESGTMPLVLVATVRLGKSHDSDVLFVQLQSPRDCGSAGCDTVSFRHTKGKWVRILDTVGGTIRVTSTRHRGMPDLIVQDTDRRVWDGEKYADTVPKPPMGLESPAVPTGDGQFVGGRWT